MNSIINKMTKLMRAAILKESRKPLIIDEVEIPEQLNYGQVLVKIHYSGICGAQLNEIDARKGEDKFLPHLLGHEGSGIVEKIGDGVSTINPGDHVVMHWRKGSGIQSATPEYKWNGNKLNAGWITTFNEYAIVSENRITKIPKDFDLKYAPLYGCAITTGYGIVNHEANTKSGESIAILGSGGVGSSVITAASLVSAFPIIAIDINDFKLNQAKKLGATHVINIKDLTTEQIKEKLFQISPEGLDVAVETTGLTETRTLASEITNNSGRTVFSGVASAGEKTPIYTTPFHFGKSISFAGPNSSNPDYEIPRLIQLHKQGNYKLDDMISHIYSLDQINDAIENVRNGNVVRCLIKMI